MTLMELVRLFDRERRLFLGTLILVCLSAWMVYQFQKPHYKNELLLSVTRTAVLPTPDYTYDYFYRFQADERMAESLSHYLASRTGKRAVAEQAKLSGEAYKQYTEAKLKTGRLGTNLVKVEYLTPEVTGGAALGEALVTVANTYVYALNEDAQQKAWFTVIGGKPVTESALWSAGRFTVVALIVGSLVAFWTVLGRFFWRQYHKQQ